MQAQIIVGEVFSSDAVVDPFGGTGPKNEICVLSSFESFPKLTASAYGPSTQTRISNTCEEIFCPDKFCSMQLLMIFSALALFGLVCLATLVAPLHVQDLRPKDIGKFINHEENVFAALQFDKFEEHERLQMMSETKFLNPEQACMLITDLMKNSIALHHEVPSSDAPCVTTPSPSDPRGGGASGAWA